MINNGMFTSNTPEWETPQDFFDNLNAEFGFTLDVCATSENAKCKNFFTEKENGLAQAWTGVCWMNPPYGREIGKWVEKAFRSAVEGATVVCLVPARTDTAWWHDYCKQGEIRFIRGRLKFGGSKWNAPFPNAVIVFRGKCPICTVTIPANAPVCEMCGEYARNANAPSKNKEATTDGH